MSGPRATAVIAAAGSGQRLGAGVPKAFVSLADRPLIGWSLESVAAAARIEAVVVAAPPGSTGLAEAALAGLGGKLDHAVVEGGATRAASVAAALGVVTTELVAIHDAARPLAPASLFDAVLARLEQRGDADGAIAAAPIADTVKRARSASGPGPIEVDVTLDRELLWAAQTPQAFRADALRAAIADGGEATDEAALVESAGGLVLIEPAPAGNLKVTESGDLAIAEALLAAAGRL